MNAIFEVKYDFSIISASSGSMGSEVVWVKAGSIQNALSIAEKEIPKRHDISNTQKLLITITSIVEAGELLN